MPSGGRRDLSSYQLVKKIPGARIFPGRQSPRGGNWNANRNFVPKLASVTSEANPVSRLQRMKAWSPETADL
jgi:hypothetical protein